MSTKFLSPGWRMPRNANQSKQSNYSMYIDVGGSSSNIDTNYYLPSGTNPKSISFWLKNVDPNGWITTGYQYTVHGGALSTGQGFGVGIIGSSSGAYIWFIGHSTADYFIPSSATGTMTTNVWYHIVVTYDNTRTNNLHFYLDGVKIDEANESLNTSSANSVKIGANATGGGGSGSQYVYVNQVCFFDYALSSSQVTTLWGGGTSVSNPMALPSPPKAYYPLGTPAWNGQYLAENNAIGDYVFDFDGVDDYIDCSSISSIPSATELTVSFWANTNSTSQNQVVFGDNSSSPIFSFEYWGSSNKMFFEYGTGTYAYLTLTSVVTAGNWHNVVLVYNASGASNTDKIKIYVDGVDKSSLLTYVGTIPTSLNASIGNFWIGNGQNYNQSFNGKISNAQIFNTALPATDVETLYNYGSPIRTLANIPQSSNLKAWYKLDASEIYNSSSTEWIVNNQAANYKTALDFSGDGAHNGVQVTSDLMSGYTNFTWSIWANAKAFPDAANYLFRGGSQSYLRESAGNLNFFINIGGTFTPLSVGFTSTNEWSHIVGIVDQANSKMKIFINGVLKATRACGSGTILTSSPFSVGCDPALVQYAWDGLLSNAQVWNLALTDGAASTVGDVAGGEIAALYNNGTPLTSSIPQSSNNKLWLKMDNLTTGIQDSSGNSNNATADSEIVQVDSFVSTGNGESSGMTQANLVQSDLQTVAPYSKYAMSFDGTDSLTVGSLFNQVQDVFSVSAWINFTSNPGYQMILSDNIWFANYTANNIGLDIKNSSGNYYDNSGGIAQGTNFVIPSDLRTNKWINVAFSYVGSSSGTTAVVKMYLNGVEMVNTTVTYSTGNANLQNASNVYLGARNGNAHYLNGSLSNVSVWNFALSPSQIREIYNQGLPSDLNSFSGTAPVAWWQLGENSSYVGGWTFADEIGSNNGTSGNLPETALTNGVGTTANGTSTGMSEGNLVGNAPYSTGNAISSGMAVTAKGTDVPPGIEVDFLVIAGGGGGGSDPDSGWGGGGGAGGYRNSYNNETSGGGSSAENNLLLSANTNYTVTVGNGGAGDTNGQDSVFATITSVGGGAGGASPTDPANNGGSGGGAARNSIGGNGTGTANQGFDGSATTSTVIAGGGGGAGSAGGSGVGYGYANSPDADGGIGLESSITGTAVKRGGGGSAPYGGAGTWGGGEAPTGGVPSSGTPNTGGGGGGRRNAGSGATGGSGVVILRYSNTKTITVGAGLTTAGEQTDGSDKYIVFTAGTGNVSFS